MVIFVVVIGYLSLWSVYWVFKLFIGKEGMGYGDFKLFVVLGVWMGLSCLLFVVLLFLLIGVLVGGMMMVFKCYECDVLMLFGLFIVVVGWVWLVVGD